MPIPQWQGLHGDHQKNSIMIRKMSVLLYIIKLFHTGIADKGDPFAVR
jgi:hypothetical protein